MNRPRQYFNAELAATPRSLQFFLCGKRKSHPLCIRKGATTSKSRQYGRVFIIKQCSILCYQFNGISYSRAGRLVLVIYMSLAIQPTARAGPNTPAIIVARRPGLRSDQWPLVDELFYVYLRSNLSEITRRTALKMDLRET